MLNNNLKLNAIAWKAKTVGKSYGMFCVALSERDKERIYLEYEQMLYTRKNDENRRLEQVRLEQAEGKTKKNRDNMEKSHDGSPL